jgi:tRNA pseudouridine(38-40) synthase
MATRRTVGKGTPTQFLVTLRYRGEPFYGTEPQREGPTVYSVLMARLASAWPQALPYAVSFAARTDRAVHARINALSFRLEMPRTGPTVADVLSALSTSPRLDGDGLEHVRAIRVDRRVMARSLICAKHYSYRWPTAGADTFKLLDALTRALSGPIDVRRLSNPRLWRNDGPSKLGPYIWRAVQGINDHGAPTLSVHVFGARFVRWQIRYVVAALAEVVAGRLTTEELLHMASDRAGPVRARLPGPAPAAGLTLMGLAVPAHAAPWCCGLGLESETSWRSAAAAAQDEP